MLSPEVRQAKERRLSELEVQAATYGLDVPPHIATEIEDLQAELELADIIARPIDQRLVNTVRTVDYAELLSKFIGDHARRLTSIEVWQKNRDEMIAIETEKREQRQAQDDTKREERQIELDAYLRHIVVLVTIAIAIGTFNTLMFILYALLTK